MKDLGIGEKGGITRRGRVWMERWGLKLRKISNTFSEREGEGRGKRERTAGGRKTTNM